MAPSSGKSGQFQKLVWRYYRKHKRDLPWRRTHNPYRILVSEIMLQQTQVERVISKYKEFLRAFPNVRSLARTPLAKILRVWQGLGYNRRALYLKKTAEVIVKNYRGRIPKSTEVLKTLPGIGTHTAGAIATFAYNQPAVFLETNIRRVFLHFLFKHKIKVHDSKILPYIAATIDLKNPREWYYALMDYGALLGKTTKNPNRRSAHYKIQKRFTGSNRQIRGKIITTLIKKRQISASELILQLAAPHYSISRVLNELMRENLVRQKNDTLMLAE